MASLPPALARRGHRVMAVLPRYADYEDGWETGVRCTFDVFGGSHEGEKNGGEREEDHRGACFCFAHTPASSSHHRFPPATIPTPPPPLSLSFPTVGYFHGYVNGIDVVFVDHPAFKGRSGAALYAGDRTDVSFRAALLSRAALEAPRVVPCGGAPYGDANLVFVANDWHAALLPVYLQANYRDHGQYPYARAVLVLHNVAHQGRGPPGDVGLYGVSGDRGDLFALDDPVGGLHSNILKAGITTAHRVVAVSDGYAWEVQTGEGGWGLDGVLRDAAAQGRLVGIVNGVDTDEWNPETDAHLSEAAGYETYGAATLAAGKAACKAALQAELGLPAAPDAPLIMFIGRLDHQKGVDLLLESTPWLVGQGCQVVLLGSGRADLEDALRALEASHRDAVRCWVGFDVPFAHRLTAGADVCVMPSRFEPCGLQQMYAQRYGTPVVAHAVGGLRSTVIPFDPAADTGTGWLFDRCEGEALRGALHNAVATYREWRPSFLDVARRGMGVDWSWTKAAEAYERELIAAKYTW